jgi:hypothetical protein
MNRISLRWFINTEFDSPFKNGAMLTSASFEFLIYEDQQIYE